MGVDIVDAAGATTLGPPLPLGGPTTNSWREHVLARAQELRFLLSWMRRTGRCSAPVDGEAVDSIERHLLTAEQAATGGGLRGGGRLLSSFGGAMIERAMSNLDAAEIELLQLASKSYLAGQLEHLLAHVRSHLVVTDARRIHMEEIVAAAAERELTDQEAEAVVAAVRVASGEARLEITRVRSFRNVLFVAALVLTLVAVGMVVLGQLRPDLVPVCFAPDQREVVCPTSVASVPASEAPSATDNPAVAVESGATQRGVDRVVRESAGPWDIAVVELVGVLAAALAAAVALRDIRGTSTPFGLPIGLAVLKLPTGALTALLGLLLMRGQFVPGLTALDTPAQIISWAIVFGYAQQLLTRLVDRQAQSVLDEVGVADPSRPRPGVAPTTAASTG